MKILRALAAATLILVSITPAALALTLKLPFSTVTEAASQAAAEAVMSCPKELLPVLVIPKGKGLLALVMNEGRFIAVEQDGDGEVQQVFFGVIEGKDTLEVREAFDLEGAKAKYPGPCDYLYPVGA